MTTSENNGNRVVVTGLGVVCSLGRGAEYVFDRLYNGFSGIRVQDRRIRGTMESWALALLPRRLNMDGFFSGWRHSPGALADRLLLMGLHDALEHAGLWPLLHESAGRTGLVTVSGSGKVIALESGLKDISGRAGDRGGMDSSFGELFESVADWGAWRYGISGPRLNLVSACSSGIVALARAYEMIRHGRADIVAAGASDVVSDLCFQGFRSLRAMDPKPCKPFDRDRDGMNLGDGCGVLVLEEYGHALKRGAGLLAEISGYGITQDARHIASPDPTGRDWAEPIRQAIDMAKIRPGELSYINAHGTGTRLNDKAETLAIKHALGKDAYDVPVSSFKAALGHCQFAAGAIEAAMTVMAIKENRVPPILGLNSPDPDCDLDYVKGTGIERHLETSLSLSFGFGGTSTAMLFSSVRAGRPGS
ncbi:MAG: beta-ketoacyl-[acyl-carrier-protein] synthase family protein [Deltaproteobacteria bacterium]|nr:beta-ketoacyl-[acyl-carrier-protein] synthase family protein [Deltaproteobacteria bacterium]